MQNNSVRQANISIMSSFREQESVCGRFFFGHPSADEEIALSPTTGSFGEEENAPVRVYDTSGPYTDPDVTINIQEGLKPLRQKWITERAMLNNMKDEL